MYNWSVDTTRLKLKRDEYEKFVLEQLINFGLRGQKISLKKLKHHWSTLNIDPDKQKVLYRMIWPKS